MPHIYVLPKQIADLIAAGEVVERPSSVIKEFIENSIDAKATVITCEITCGGKTYIRVTDNGCGIERADIKNAFVSHATSKIRAAEDLDAIGTLGFRGEALASVAAVARVDILTRCSFEQIGTHYVIEGGEEKLLDDAGCPVGTTLVVRDLFYNIPARMKFLKKDVQEGNTVSTIVERLALSHPEVSFRLIRDGKAVINTPGDGVLRNAIFAVFGRDFTESLLEVNSEYNGIKISGFIGKPSSGKNSRSCQMFYINNRFVKSLVFMTALEAAYKNQILVGKYPSCVLFCEAPLSSVDVNVHPAKTDVRFFEERRIFDAVYQSALSVLTADTSRPQASFSMAKALNPEPIKGEQLRFAPERKDEKAVTYSVKEYGGFSASDGVVFNSPAVEGEAENEQLLDFLKDEPQVSAERTLKISFSVTGNGAKEPLGTAFESFVDEASNSDSENNDSTVEESAVVPDFRYIGEAFRTYLIAECEGKLILIDKHAAHERILFEKFRNEATADTQLLLQPVIVTLDSDAYSAVIENCELLKNAGYEVSDFGDRTVKLSSCPSLLIGENLSDLLTEIAEYLKNNDRTLMPEKLDWIFHSSACRAAVKAGNFTSSAEAQRFVHELLSRPDIKCCPHGRPVLTELPRRELEKLFRRIV